MAISERRRLTFTIIAVIGLAIVTGLLIYSLFLSPKTPMTTTTPTTTATTTLTPGPFEVRISGFAFEPETITVSVGTTLTWRHMDSDGHAIISSTGLFRSDFLFSGDTFSYTFTQAGTFGYYCDPHAGSMSGKVIVE